jgi:hypothetical protein
MSKVLLWVAVVFGAIYLVRVNYFGSKTYEPFLQGCVASGATEARCTCLTDYVHERFDDLEVRKIMTHNMSDEPLLRELSHVRRLNRNWLAVFC